MKVILKKRVANLGQEWDLVTVKNGYARNFLLPQDLAEMATPALLKRAEKHIANRGKKLQEILDNAKETAEKLAGVTLKFTKKARGEKLYGSIAEKDVAEALLKENKIEISKEMVIMAEHIKTVGDHKVKIRLTEEVSAEISVSVAAE